MSWNQEMTAAPGVARLPQDTRGRSEASIGVFAKFTGRGGGYPVTETAVSSATQEAQQGSF